MITEPIDLSVDAFLQVRDVEVDQQADAQAAQPQVREQLSVVNGQHRFDRFQFDDHDFVDEQIDSITEIDRESFNPDGKLLLGFNEATKIAQDVVGRPSVNKHAVPSVRVGVLRGSAVGQAATMPDRPRSSAIWGGCGSILSMRGLLDQNATTEDTEGLRRSRSIRVLTVPIDLAMNSFFQARDVEVDQEPHPHSAQSQIRKQLSVVDRQNRFDGFHFDNDDFVDQQIDPVAELDCESLIPNGKVLLGFDQAAKVDQLERETRAISTLEQARTQTRVHFVGAAQDVVGRPSMNKQAVSSVRVRALRGSAFEQAATMPDPFPFPTCQP